MAYIRKHFTETSLFGFEYAMKCVFVMSLIFTHVYILYDIKSRNLVARN